MEEYTGRQIAILSDIHGLLEPLEAILEDIKARGITEIYSLGDNIGEGPNPYEVVTLLEKFNVKSIAGNAEEYVRLGTKPFPYVNVNSCVWTNEQLREEGKRIVTQYPRYIELEVGGKKVGLCHFANDIRFNFKAHSTWSYQAFFDRKTGKQLNNNSSDQFNYTNSLDEKNYITQKINDKGTEIPEMQGIVSAYNDPLFGGKPISQFDTIFQGHTHWKYYDKNPNTTIYTIRAAGMAYRDDPLNSASYIILRERANNKGFDMQEILVPFDREKMVASILESTNPDKKIQSFTSITQDEIMAYEDRKQKSR